MPAGTVTTESIESYVHRVPIAKGMSGPVVVGVELESGGAMLAIASLRPEVTVPGSGTIPES